MIERALIKSVTTMLGDLGLAVYQLDFEGPFLSHSREFYGVEAQEYIGSCDCPAYLAHVERRLGEEVDRVAAYLLPETEARLVQVGGLGSCGWGLWGRWFGSVYHLGDW
jgi:cullin 3